MNHLTNQMEEALAEILMLDPHTHLVGGKLGAEFARLFRLMESVVRFREISASILKPHLRRGRLKVGRPEDSVQIGVRNARRGTQRTSKH